MFHIVLRQGYRNLQHCTTQGGMDASTETMAAVSGEDSVTVLHGVVLGFEAMFHCVSSMLHVQNDQSS